MLEEFIMDKKSNNRQAPPQPRSSAVDCKKSESSCKPTPRYNKKREGSNTAPKNDPTRKNVASQRGRGEVDRRPRVRGSSGYSLGEKEISRLGEHEPELGSVFVPGCKKQNFNQLLNFSYAPRGTERRTASHQSVKPRVSRPHNNDLYLQACCQFVVKEDGDYRANLLDPDVPVKWEQIEEIVVRSTGKAECPICLGAHAAGRVGRCGHVFCWPCALHYTAAHDRQPPPCPVCAAPFRVDAMKPARIVQWAMPGEEVTMRLVRRLRDSNVVELAPERGQTTIATAEIQPMASLTDSPFGKLFFATKEEVQEILERERKELQEQILAEIDTTEVVYMEEALKTLEMQEKVSNNNVTTSKSTVQNINDDNVPIVIETNNLTNTPKIDWFDEEEGAACLENVKQTEMSNLVEEIQDLYVTETSSLNPEAPEFELSFGDAVSEFPLVEEDTDNKVDDNENTVQTLTEEEKELQAKYFYFYQAEDGQQTFLHRVNVCVLTSSWGGLVAAPRRLRGRVLSRETKALDDQQSRKHIPYAAHLSLHCPLDIVELDLKPPDVTVKALEQHADLLKQRARQRTRLANEERRREAAYRRAAEGPPRPDFSSALLFPPPSTSPPQPSSPPVVPVVDTGAQQAASPPGIWAKMASSGGAWRTRAAPVRAPSPPPEDDAAPRTLSLSDAIEAALHAAPTTKNKKKKNKRTSSNQM